MHTTGTIAMLVTGNYQRHWSHNCYLDSYFAIASFLLQILNPNPDAMSKMITENASEEFLHSLSNYCALQVGRQSL